MAIQLDQVRLTNLRWLIRQEGSVTQLATKLTISPIYIFNVLDGQFTIGDALARKIESIYGYSRGWMDGSNDIKISAEPVVPVLTLDQARQPEKSPEPNEGDNEFLSDFMSTLEDAAVENGLNLTPEQKEKYLLDIEKSVADKKQK